MSAYADLRVKDIKPVQSNEIFMDSLSVVTLHWNLPTLLNNAHIDGCLPRSNMVKSVYE